MSGSSRIPKLSLGILATSIAVTGLSYAIPGADPLKNAAIVGGLGSLLQSLWTNLFTGDLADHRKSLPKSAQDLYRNGHLETLYKNSIAACIESAKDDAHFADTGIIADTLAALHAAFEKDHGTEFIRALPDLETADVTDIIHDFLSAKNQIPNATPAAWREFLDTLIGRTDSNTISTLRDRIAERIHTDFARALYERAKESAAKSPETFAGILLHFQSDTLSAITDTARTIDRELLPAVRSVVEGQAQLLQLIGQSPDLQTLTQTFAKQLDQLKTHDLANADRYDKIAAQLRFIKRRLADIKDDTSAIREDIGQIKEDNSLLFAWLQEFQSQVPQIFPQDLIQKAPPFNIPKGAPKLIGRDNDLTELHRLYADHHHIAITGGGGIGKTALCSQFLSDLMLGAQFEELPPGTNKPPHAIYAHDFYQRPSLPAFIGGILEQAGISTENTKLQPALCAMALRQPGLLLYIEGAEKLHDLADLLRFIAPTTRLILTTRDPIQIEALEEYRLFPLEQADAAEAIHYYADKRHRTQNRRPHPQPLTDDGWRILARDMGGHALACRLTGEHCGRFSLNPSAFHETLYQNGLRPLIHGPDSKHNLHILFRQTALALIEACPEQADSPEGAQCNSPGSATQERSPGFAHTDDLALKGRNNQPPENPAQVPPLQGSSREHADPGLRSSLADPGLLHSAPSGQTHAPVAPTNPTTDPAHPASRIAHPASRPANPAIIAWHALTLGGTNPVPLSILRELGVEGDAGLRALCDMAVARSEQVASEQEGQTEPAYALIHALLGEWARTGLTEFGRPPETLLRPAMKWGEAMLDKVEHHQHVPGGPERYLLLHPIAEALLREVERIEPADPKEGGRPGPLNSERVPINPPDQGGETPPLRSGAVPAPSDSEHAPTKPIQPGGLPESSRGLSEERAIPPDQQPNGPHPGRGDGAVATSDPRATTPPPHPGCDEPAHNPGVSLVSLAQPPATVPQPSGLTPPERPRAPQANQPPLLTITPDERDTFYYLLARMHELHGNFIDAEPVYRRALARMESDAPENSPPIATALNNLAELLRATNRITEAEPMYRRVVEIFEKSYGENHPNVATALNNLALLLRATNRLAEAEPMYRRALAIDEQSYGPHHPDVAINLNNLAGLLRATNRLAEAEPMYRRALAIDEQSYGPHHPTVAIRLNNLAELLRATNRFAEAEPMFRRALAIDEQSYGPHHPSVARDLNNLAVLLDDTGRRKEAAPMYRRALLIRLRSFAGVPGVHSDVRQGVRNYVIASMEMGLAEDVFWPRLFETFSEAGISKERMKEILDYAWKNT